MNQAGVFSRPTEPGRGGERALDNGSGVDVRSRLEFPKLLVQPRLDRANSLEQNLVVVARPPLAPKIILAARQNAARQHATRPRIPRDPPIPALRFFS